MHFRILLIAALLFQGIVAFSQEAMITGTVTDERNEPVPFANAVLYNHSDSSMVTGGVTDFEGEFSFGAPHGQYYMIVSSVSYHNKTLPQIDLNKNIDLGVIKLKESTEILETVVVEGERSQMTLSLDKRVFEVGKDLSNIGGSAADILDNVPSVAVDVEGNVSLRGSQNVRILINGRPSSLTGINTADAMRQLQGNMIERVEIITNPSSRYDAEGEVGIINIILRKEKNTAGSFSVRTGYPDNFGGSFNLNVRKNKINYFGDIGASYRSSPGSGSSLQSFTDSDSSFSYAQDQSRVRTSKSLNGRAGIDFTLPEGGIITAAGAGRLSDGLNTTNNVYEDFNSTGTLVRTVLRTERESEPEVNLEGSVSYRKEFDTKGRLFTADLKWIENNETEKAVFEQTDLSLDSVGFQRSSNTENERNLLFQSDYVHPFGDKGKMEAGVKTTRRVIENNFLVEQLDTQSEIWMKIPRLDNGLTYLEDIHAGYFMLGNQYDRFSWQAGVRGELSRIDVRVRESDGSGRQSYFNIFPSAHLSFEHARDRTLQLSYSYRLSRPGFRDLMPFSNYSDNRAIRIGNPQLRPEYTHAMEAGYLVDWDKGSVLSSIYYRYRTGVIEQITSVDSLAVTSSIPVNLSTQNAYGLEFTISLNPVEWWRLNGTTNFYRALTRGQYQDQDFFSDTYTNVSRATSQFTLLKKWLLQAGLNYRAPRVTTQGRNLAVTYLDLGLSRDFLKGNGTATFSVRDVFNTRKFRTVIDREDIGFYSTRDFQWRARQFLLTLTYRLNVGKEKARMDVDRDNDFGDD